MLIALCFSSWKLRLGALGSVRAWILRHLGITVLGLSLLACLGCRERVETLVSRLNDNDPAVREEAARKLGLIRRGMSNLPSDPADRDAIAALERLLNDDDVGVRQSAAEALGRIGPAAKSTIPALIRALADKESCVRSSAVLALGDMGALAKQAVPALLKVLKGDSNAYTRAFAAEALAEIDPYDSKIAAALREAVNDKDTSVRSHAASALREIGATAE